MSILLHLGVGGNPDGWTTSTCKLTPFLAKTKHCEKQTKPPSKTHRAFSDLQTVGVLGQIVIAEVKNVIHPAHGPKENQPHLACRD